MAVPVLGLNKTTFPVRFLIKMRSGFSEFVDLLTSETASFDGQVLLVHGDTHRYRVDQPLRDPVTLEPLPNFTRAEVFGSPDVNWVRVRAADSNGGIKFEISPGR